MQPPDFTFRISEPIIAPHQQIASCARYTYGCVGSIQSACPRKGETEGFVFDASASRFVSGFIKWVDGVPSTGIEMAPPSSTKTGSFS